MDEDGCTCVMTKPRKDQAALGLAHGWTLDPDCPYIEDHLIKMRPGMRAGWVSSVGWLKAQLLEFPDDTRVLLDCDEGVYYAPISVYAQRPNDSGIGVHRVRYARGAVSRADDLVVISSTDSVPS